MGYSLNRYRPLKQIDPTTVKRLARIWNLSLDNPWARPQLRHRLQYLTPLAATRAIQPLRCLSKSRLSLKHPAFAALAKAHLFCKLIELCLRRLGSHNGVVKPNTSRKRVRSKRELLGRLAIGASPRKWRENANRRDLAGRFRRIAGKLHARPQDKKSFFYNQLTEPLPGRNLLGARGQLQGGSRGPMDVTLGEGPS